MEEKTLTPEDRKKLLEEARRMLEVRLGDGERLPADAAWSDAVGQNRGAFVTLTRGGQLRGCIGTFRPRGSLLDTVREMACQAALSDPRFPPVSLRELAELEIEISALTPLRKIDDPQQVEVGKHGLYITKGYRGGVLLPQVATDWGWDRREFLEATCQKAGLGRDDWKQGATIEVFEAEVFSEGQ